MSVRGTPRGPARTALANRRLLERLRLLCECGAGLEAVAAPACAIVRDLVGARSASIFWLDRHGAPAGFFHDCAPAELKDLFVTRFDELFSSPGEFNMVTYTRPVGPPIGQMLTESGHAAFRASNVYKHLCVPLGHHHGLEMRIEHAGRGVGVLVLWNEAGRPFTAADVAVAEPTRRLLERALEAERPDVVWRSQGSRTAHYITDVSGQDLMAINAEAEEMLNRGHLLGQNVPMARRPRAAPAFSRRLAEMLANGAPAELHLPVIDGRLAVRASPSSRLVEGGDDEPQMFVSVDVEVAADVLAVERLSALPLTLLQKQIALFAAQGGLRADCEDRFGVSQEALKKHLSTIYDATGVSGWSGLRENVLAGAGEEAPARPSPAPSPAWRTTLSLGLSLLPAVF
ncbi:MAG: hypothetical protein JNL41_16135 [Phenylobacterium sp.]|uniref:hypothetical protein n=1 Tax=Phenylobacterium sp. TaxID=1871053 RepID=UPI001A3FE106|nr:hypothetical protein [Phenylobacterium sp.]MBL8555805.1 hypothetical protein [Phenylobacterium sp.]